jgi:AAA family ATP:ADP antiporter
VTARLRSGEDARAAAAAVAAAAVIIAFQLAGKATRDALFLSTFGVAALPTMVIAAAVLSAVLSAVLAQIMARTSPGRLVPRLFGLSSALLLAEWGLVPQARHPAAVLVYLHFTALGAILVSGFWAIVNERFDPRTARRAIGRITAGGSVGGLLGGLLPERVGAALPLTAMLPILAGLHLVAAGLVLRVQQDNSGSGNRANEVLEPEPVLRAGRVLRNSSYLLGLAMLVTLTSAAEGLLDYVFKARASAATSSGEQLLRLFAAFYTATALLGIFIQVTALRKVLARLGIAGSASLLPAGVSVGAVLAFLFPGLLPVTVARGTEVVLRSSVFRGAYELLFTPVAPSEKRATKLLIDVGSARVGDVLGGGLILTALALTGSAAVRVLLAVTFAISVGALLVARRLRQGYVAALEGSLQRRAGELPDPIQDDAAALLQTVGAFDLSGIRPRLTLSVGSPHAAEPPQPAPTTPASETPLSKAIPGGNVDEVRAALAEHPLADDQLDTAIELLAWDAVAPQVIRSLGALARTRTNVLLDHLLDPDEDFAIRRRLVNVLAGCRTAEAFEGLFQALNDQRFEVRYRASRALSRMAGEIPGLYIERDRVLAVVQREIGVERGVWESRQLIDPDEEPSPMETELLRDRANRSLEHLFTLLSLILPQDTLRLAYQGLQTGDSYLRGTALEYLETVLPEPTWTRLWPLLEQGESQPRSRKPSDQAVRELLASRETIGLALAEARRRGRA